MRTTAIERSLLEDASLSPETASDGAFRFLRAMIFSGDLGPGDRLPPERDLCARLGISRMTLRAALKSLESAGYIVTTRGPHGGSRISDSEALSDCWRQWMRDHLSELDDIFEFRNTVETRLAALAAERRTDADIRAMQQALAGEQSPKDWSSVLHANVDLHRGVARAAHSPRLERAMLGVRGELFVPVDFVKLDAQSPRVGATHQAILEAIRDGDPARAADEMRRHLAVVRELTDIARQASGLLPDRK